MTLYYEVLGLGLWCLAPLSFSLFSSGDHGLTLHPTIFQLYGGRLLPVNKVNLITDNNIKSNRVLYTCISLITTELGRNNIVPNNSSSNITVIYLMNMYFECGMIVFSFNKKGY